MGVVRWVVWTHELEEHVVEEGRGAGLVAAREVEEQREDPHLPTDPHEEAPVREGGVVRRRLVVAPVVRRPPPTYLHEDVGQLGQQEGQRVRTGLSQPARQVGKQAGVQRTSHETPWGGNKSVSQADKKAAATRVCGLSRWCSRLSDGVCVVLLLTEYILEACSLRYDCRSR